MVQLSPSCERCSYRYSCVELGEGMESLRWYTRRSGWRESQPSDLPQNERFIKRKREREREPPSSRSIFFFFFTKLPQRSKVLSFYRAIRFCSRRSAPSAASLRQKLQDEAQEERADRCRPERSPRDRDFYSRIDLGCQVGENYASRSKPNAP